MKGPLQMQQFCNKLEIYHLNFSWIFASLACLNLIIRQEARNYPLLHSSDLVRSSFISLRVLAASKKKSQIGKCYKYKKNMKR